MTDPRHRISDIANEQGVSEYEVFQQAFRSYYGTTATVERDFGLYLTHGEIPIYVNHFIRQQAELVA